MDDWEKQKTLRKYKRMATGLFLFMLLVYIGMSLWINRYPQNWMGYVQAFAEAAMIGALADWFAVTALFHHPLGIPIPHTNLIEKSKQSIGNNLGDFVVQNFLNPTAIRPYIQRISIAQPLGDWLMQEKNQQQFVDETSKLLGNILRNADDTAMQSFISNKAKELVNEIKFSNLAAAALHYVVAHEEHQKVISLMAEKIKQYVVEHENMILEKVEAESYFFIPKFIDRKLSAKITRGLYNYFHEIESDPQHRVRQEISKQLASLAEELQTHPTREAEIKKLIGIVFSQEKLDQYAGDIWTSLKKTLLHEMQTQDSALRQYFRKQMQSMANELQHDDQLKHRINSWIRFNAYRYAMRNREQVGRIISTTVGNWEGRELSRKLELEVGKDLQFIRVNGTLVGGLMGLLIHIISNWFQ